MLRGVLAVLGDSAFCLLSYVHVVECTASWRHVYNRSATTTTALSAKCFVDATPADAGERSRLAATLAAALRCYRQRVSDTPQSQLDQKTF